MSDFNPPPPGVCRDNFEMPYPRQYPNQAEMIYETMLNTRKLIFIV